MTISKAAEKWTFSKAPNVWTKLKADNKWSSSMTKPDIPAAGGFSPNDLSPDYFNEDIKTFTGSNYVDTGIYNTPFSKNYWHVFLKLAPTDGQPPDFRIPLGSRNSDGDTLIQVRFQMDGRMFARMGWLNDITTDPVWEDEANAYKVLRISNDLTNKKLYVDGVLEDTFTADSCAEDLNYTMAYGAYNDRGSIGYHYVGGSKALFIWGGTVDLTPQNITDLTTWFSIK